MGDDFLKKKGVVVNNIALDLMPLKRGDKVPSISEYQKKYNVSRGTVQNAFTYLKNIKAISCKNHGHLGTFIEEVNYSLLQEYIFRETILGTMPLPYSRLYEGMATGIYKVFRNNNTKLNLAYIRGSNERIRSIINKTYRFAVVSKFSAQFSIDKGEPIDILIDFGEGTYLSEHVLLLADTNKKELEKGMKVGIDYSSLDQQMITKSLIKDKEVKLIEMEGHRIISALNSKMIDAGVWNYDEIKDKNYQGLHYLFLKKSKIHKDMSTSVIAIHRDDSLIKSFFNVSLDKKKILDIQQKVFNGEIVPQY